MSPNDHALVKAYEKLVDLVYDEMGEQEPSFNRIADQLNELDVLRRKYTEEHAHDMWVVIEDPSSGEIEMCRQLGPDEKMDARQFADEYASQMGVAIDEPSGYIPNCCGDIRVEFRRDPDNSVHIWSGESFYFKREE